MCPRDSQNFRSVEQRSEETSSILWRGRLADEVDLLEFKELSVLVILSLPKPLPRPLSSLLSFFLLPYLSPNHVARRSHTVFYGWRLFLAVL